MKTSRIVVLISKLTFAIISTHIVLSTLPAHAELAGQNPSEPPAQDTQRIAVTVTVTNGRNELVTGLTRADFSVFADKVPQTISYFRDDDGPASVGILFDASDSMRTRWGMTVIKAYRDSFRQFFARSHQGNEYFLMSFGLKPQLLVDWTSDEEAIENGFDAVQFKGNTAFFDACHAGVQKVTQGRNEKRAIILVSDGEDNESTHRKNEIRSMLRKYNVLVYSINIFAGPDASGSALGFEGQSILNELSRMSGGMTFYPKSNQRVSISELNSVLNFIADELRHQYLIGFIPSIKPVKDKWQRIAVKINTDRTDPGMRGLTIRARDGYVVSP